MNIETLLLIEPRLVGLIDRARTLGQGGHDWWSTLMLIHEDLSHIAGRGASIEAMQPSIAYEVCRQALSRAWQNSPVVDGVDDQPMFPWSVGWGDDTVVDSEPELITETR